ncbi:AmmeMemoRadiSam system radical SAM enzyme [bacterium (Candidatus Blackallbacteria) CG17_big_fil_post_rev_8_21_14_2_50_48_46]|uniref:AmmeMemoRadiSam system radical SAM enzyme n=1 Tax=bacterium (Candidatus Blackallbacteria) CG17_big_fil_post_rev_8_21_14_2_50_48_46 TaxID=2014261 RepID=A0A2M7G2J3_9BACT|nr:MAG: AmmeMemoRadiSam system radical SAM enzyme [bacterium (Candidatus Blackallbacteria) CG18_big_fil_WC_8_21_14_2_50_49_26]PIW15945.1 MAG: AmmeMemoRadiSam system radical SAM enzyme [bacterium (Candidatus Blackallbacteria) CG17_big_fil_post_rev_8_21_14_2_50_48_46]PIW50357.1 MAG: AmmeMemoRadiSam system radical SAM enzyme [bacterium (Candidatus Blackallbacteria) CG13_big_fil_rev_8_21_14_2_50_49_14]
MPETPAETMPIAQWWETDEKGKILCTLCPRFCRIGAGQAGFCYVRQNIEGKLYAASYGKSTGFAIDPIEKKPLNHFLPGSAILSFGTAGCNLGCRFCQNWHISKARLVEKNSVAALPEQVVALAQQHGCPSIAMTYNDPTIFGEYVIDISRLARDAGLRNILVTAGYITPEARQDIYRYIDAANVDLKAFSETFYHKLTFSHLEPVLNTLRWLKHETNIWFEITNLMIPGHNDSWDETRRMCEWILENLGPEVPLHFTAFHPDFKLQDSPRTPQETLNRARRIAQSMGIHYVYVGNVHDREGQTTFCPHCQKPLIERDWHRVLSNHLTQAQCPECHTEIAGVFTQNSPRLLKYGPNWE